MNKKNNYKIISQISAAVVSIFVFKYFDLDVAFLAPLFILCGEGEGGEGGEGGSGGGGDAGAGCCGASGLAGGSSTPFLCTWDGQKFQFENDFLFGKPTTLFRNKKEGLLAYENGNISGDLYKIKNNFSLKENNLSFQVKEIEPEESYIDHLSLLRVVHSKDSEVIINSKFNSFSVFNKAALLKKEGIESQAIFWNTEDVTSTIGSTVNFSVSDKNTGRYMYADKDVIEIKGKIQDKNNEAYLVLKSHFRDWILEDVFLDNSKTKLSWLKVVKVAPKSFMKMVALASIVTILNITTNAGSFLKKSNYDVSDEQENSLAEAFGVNKVFADAQADPFWGGGSGKSFIISYWNGTFFETIDVYSPRYYQPDTNLITIPKEAISESGEVHIKITATKKHKLHFVSLVSPYVNLDSKSEKLSVTKAFHVREKKEYKNILNTQYSGEYLHTIPSDIVDVTFEKGKLILGEDEKESYLLQASGFYTDLSNESRAKAGDWVSKLDPESSQWLKQMYSLKTYNNKVGA